MFTIVGFDAMLKTKAVPLPKFNPGIVHVTKLNVLRPVMITNDFVSRVEVM